MNEQGLAHRECARAALRGVRRRTSNGTLPGTLRTKPLMCLKAIGNRNSLQLDRGPTYAHCHDHTSGYELAQLNIARPIEPLTSARLAGFVDLLDPVNALADAAPGFVWRLQTEDGDATAVRGFDDDQLIVNMSTWHSLSALVDFVFGSFCVEVMRLRREWFARMKDPFTVLWWVPDSQRPAVSEAEERLATLRRLGPTAEAFTFRRPFGAPKAVAETPSNEA